MEFFVSWTSRDPVIQKYDQEANVLISPYYVTNTWSISKWKTLPAKLFVDSGAYSINEKTLCPEDILKRQTHISKKWPNHKKLYFCHPDLIIPMRSSFIETNKIINISLERAKKYINLIKKNKNQCIPVGVIHGFDEETLLLSYQELYNAGYRHFAIGSLAIRISHSKKQCLKAIKTITEFSDNPVHLFGVLLPSHSFCHQVELDSFDSAAPAKLGYYGTVLYGPNLEHYVISPSAKQKIRDRFWRFRKATDEPFHCDCPICKFNPQILNSKDDKRSKINRIIHNYFQIKWATEKIT